MKTFSLLSLALLMALTLVPTGAARARGGNRRGGNVVYAAPAAASPAAVAAPAARNPGYRSFSYQPAATSAPTYYRSSSTRRGNQPTWMMGSAKSLGIYK